LADGFARVIASAFERRQRVAALGDALESAEHLGRCSTDIAGRLERGLACPQPDRIAERRSDRERDPHEGSRSLWSRTRRRLRLLGDAPERPRSGLELRLAAAQGGALAAEIESAADAALLGAPSSAAAMSGLASADENLPSAPWIATVAGTPGT